MNFERFFETLVPVDKSRPLIFGGFRCRQLDEMSFLVAPDTGAG